MGWLLAFFCFKGAAMDVGAAEVWRLDLARFPLGGGGRRRRGSIQESEVLGCVPGRRAFADGFCYCNSNKASVRWGSSGSWGARLLLRRRRVRAGLLREGSRGAVVIFYFFRVLFVVWRKQPSMYPPRMVLYFYGFLYVFLNYGIQKRIIKKNAAHCSPRVLRLP